MSLLEIFLAHSPAAPLPHEAPDGAALERCLAELHARGAAAWPSLTVPAAAFVRHVAERLPAGSDPLASLRQLHAEDLYLAMACGQRDPQALGLFETHHLEPLSLHFQRAEALRGFSQEVKQSVRVRLFVAEGDVLPRILSYTGRGPLGAWLRMVAARLAVDERRAAEPIRPAEDLAELCAPEPDPEIGFFKTHYRQELRAAIEAALSSLPGKEKAILRLYFYEGLSADAIGRMYAVSARTVQRWVAEIRGRIFDETRGRLQAKLQITAGQFNSLVGLVQSEIDLTLHRLLGSALGARPTRA